MKQTGEDLLPDYMEWCKKFKITCVTYGVPKDVKKAK